MSIYDACDYLFLTNRTCNIDEWKKTNMVSVTDEKGYDAKETAE